MTGIPGTESLYTASQTRALDRYAIDICGIPGITLMGRAAAASYDMLLDLWPDVEHLQVLCGTGNNGGDGYLLADLAHKRGMPVSVFQLGDPDRIAGDARLARGQALQNGVVELPFVAGCLNDSGVVVDAMLGTGLGGEVRGAYQEAIAEINASMLPVLALDIPSGLCSDTGRSLGEAVVADATVTFIGLKRGLFTLDAADHVGVIQFTDLMVPPEVYQQQSPGCERLILDDCLCSLPSRHAASHKGSFGSVLVIGGDYGMGGAVTLAAEAALRCGAGLVRVATRPDHVSAIVARRPEVMAFGVVSGQELAPLLDSADVLVVGPGLGQSPWSEQLLRVAAASGKTMVLDADGLNLLVGRDIVEIKQRDNWVLTPHPAEAARLLETSTVEVQSNRFASASALQARYGGVAVLKGNGTVVAAENWLGLSDYGNPGMASGGMGDILSGVVGSLIAQGVSLREAASLSVCLHGAAADEAVSEGMRGLLASDLLAPMRRMLG